MLPLIGKRGMTLTPRRKEVIRWIAMGKTNHEIGVLTGLSPLTVKNHVQFLSLAYGVNGGDGGNRVKIVIAALLRGDIALEEFRETFEKCMAHGRLAA